MTWERWSSLSSHGALWVGEMVQMAEKSCSRTKENIRNLLERTIPTAFRAREKRKELAWQKLTLNAITTKFKAELRFGSQILSKYICSNSLCFQWPLSHRFSGSKLRSIGSSPTYSTLLYLHTNPSHFGSFDWATSASSVEGKPEFSTGMLFIPQLHMHQEGKFKALTPLVTVYKCKPCAKEMTVNYTLPEAYTFWKRIVFLTAS